VARFTLPRFPTSHPPFLLHSQHGKSACGMNFRSFFFQNGFVLPPLSCLYGEFFNFLSPTEEPLRKERGCQQRSRSATLLPPSPMMSGVWVCARSSVSFLTEAWSRVQLALRNYPTPSTETKVWCLVLVRVSVNLRRRSELIVNPLFGLLDPLFASPTDSNLSVENT
jgi:hypothetical protein